MKQKFIISKGKQADGAELLFSPGADYTLTNTHGKAFGEWLLQNGSTSFLRGLQEVMHEAEIDKKDLVIDIPLLLVYISSNMC